ncbi:uncharacterized protein LOC127755240 [Oryza glaberrima]|uniref:Uncharacterized protein n=1 Tax=Oryza glaberrima TaxID=4538 RepID=I1QXT5_ORYGL|nr:uncharacterized protein LOC127755240 [Oryza glaberrima]
MERLLHFRPPKPTSANAVAAAATADGDLLELDVLWPASRAPDLLAALPEEDGKRRRKRGGSGSGSVAVRSAARPIPETAALTLVPSSSAAAMAKSAPVRIPSEAAAARRGVMWAAQAGSEDGEAAMVPPHEIVARRAAAHSSVLEGSGRTLKGRDLHRVRNAVLRRTGFLD